MNYTYLSNLQNVNKSERIHSSKGLISVFFIFIVFGFSKIGSSQNFNRPTPTNFPKYEFQRYDTTELDGCYLLAPHRQDGASGWSKGLSVIDEDGYLVWWTALNKKGYNFNYYPTLKQYSFSEKRNGDIQHVFLDTNFVIVDSLNSPSSYVGDIHEMLIMSNGNKLILTSEFVTVDLSLYNFGGIQGNSNTVLIDPVIVEFDASNAVIWEWKARDYLPIDMFNDTYGYNVNGFDYLHPNSVEEAFGNKLIVSFRNANSIIEIDKATGTIDWIFGGAYNEFSLQNDGGFLGQHDARIRPDGTISMFDNQLWGELESRGVVFDLDTVSMTATKVSEYHHPNSVKGNIMGNYSVTLNNHELISWGSSRRPDPTISLINEFEERVAEFFFEDTVITYRTFFQTLDMPTRPEITCSFNGTNYTLTAPIASYYLWSNGETTQSIVLSDTGNYVVWVNHGIGMLGSKPFYVNDISNSCPSASITENPSIQGIDKIAGYYSALGKRLKNKPLGVVCLIRFESGRVVRSFFLE